MCYVCVHVCINIVKSSYVTYEYAMTCKQTLLSHFMFNNNFMYRCYTDDRYDSDMHGLHPIAVLCHTYIEFIYLNVNHHTIPMYTYYNYSLELSECVV